MFLPFSDLGLIIVDEEHEGSFKQFDPAPRYHARDAAVVLSNLHEANILLGSATPSVESFYNAQKGKYGYAQITRRYGNVLMPDIDGFETCSRLKANLSTRDIPVIFLTALSETVNKVQGFKLGGVDYITKPFQVEEVLARLDTHLTIRNLQIKLEAQNNQLQQFDY